MQPHLSHLSLNLGNILIRPRLFVERNLPVKDLVSGYAVGFCFMFKTVKCPGFSVIFIYFSYGGLGLEHISTLDVQLER